MSRKKPPQEPSALTLFRYQAVSQVLLRERQGEKRSEAVREVARQAHLGPDGRPRAVSVRSLYRWLAAYEKGGFEALTPAERSGGAGSGAVSEQLLAFLKAQKRDDPRTSVPELLRRAREEGKISPEETVHRCTVWREMRRAGIETRRRKPSASGPARRFAHPHRLDLVLCDGKHFRAGTARLKRVALFFLDDATRLGLNVAVGTAETARLFLRGLYECLLRYGLMRSLYVDHGSGFIALDSIEALRRLGVLFIHGSPAYPQGRGKVERLHRTASEQLLRLLDGRPGVDPDCGAVELRLRHYLERRYNRTPHESLDGETPLERFQADPVPLRFAADRSRLQRAFVLYVRRRVSRDHVVSVRGVRYETPEGSAGARVTLHRNLLDGSVAMLHEGRLVRLSPLDEKANARRPRAAAKSGEPEPDRPASSAETAFRRDLEPLVDPEGGFAEPDRESEDKTEPNQSNNEEES